MTPSPLRYHDGPVVKAPNTPPEVAALRRSLRWTQVVAAVALVIAVVPKPSPSRAPIDDVLVLRDREGHRRIELSTLDGKPFIALYGKQGPARVRLEASDYNGLVSVVHGFGGASPPEGVFLRSDRSEIELTSGDRGASLTLSGEPHTPAIAARGPEPDAYWHLATGPRGIEVVPGPGPPAPPDTVNDPPAAAAP